MSGAFTLHKSQRIVYLVWIYTHREFGRKNNTRPPDKDLQKEFDIIRQDIEDLDKTENPKIAPHTKAGEI
ncbi:MAG TPA: hypothetical protein VK369_16200 [Segetibacter sp.]|nr:hypothetical protein [Segetibacter sp.]